MSTDFRALMAQMAAELDHNRRCLLDDATLTHPLADRARYLLAKPADAPAVPATSQTSDGYHTFEELYEHRHALFLALIKAAPVGCFTRSWKHNDGEFCFGGDEWFIVSGQLPGASQISYHLPRRLWKIAGAAGANEVEQSGPWDGHTAVDVVDRLLGYAGLAEADAPAAPPAEGPSDEELGLIYHDCCRGCEFMDQVGFEDAARAVLARWGQPPAPLAEGEVAELARWLRLRNPIDMEGEPDDCTYFMLTRAAELLERHAAPVPVPGVAHTRYKFSVCDETGMEVAGGSAPTYAQALSEGRHYLAQYQQDEPHTLELRRVEVLDPGALPLPAPQGGETQP